MSSLEPTPYDRPLLPPNTRAYREPSELLPSRYSAPLRPSLSGGTSLFSRPSKQAHVRAPPSDDSQQRASLHPSPYFEQPNMLALRKQRSGLQTPPGRVLGPPGGTPFQQTRSRSRSVTSGGVKRGRGSSSHRTSSLQFSRRRGVDDESTSSRGSRWGEASTAPDTITDDVDFPVAPSYLGKGPDLNRTVTAVPQAARRLPELAPWYAGTPPTDVSTDTSTTEDWGKPHDINGDLLFEAMGAEYVKNKYRGRLRLSPRGRYHSSARDTVRKLALLSEGPLSALSAADTYMARGLLDDSDSGDDDGDEIGRGSALPKMRGGFERYPDDIARDLFNELSSKRAAPAVRIRVEASGKNVQTALRQATETSGAMFAEQQPFFEGKRSVASHISQALKRSRPVLRDLTNQRSVSFLTSPPDPPSGLLSIYDINPARRPTDRQPTPPSTPPLLAPVSTLASQILHSSAASTAPQHVAPYTSAVDPGASSDSIDFDLYNMIKPTARTPGTRGASLPRDSTGRWATLGLKDTFVQEYMHTYDRICAAKVNEGRTRARRERHAASWSASTRLLRPPDFF
ncbi:hypothetical protein DIPPA_24069 [Diplonema papillatum]|nr:hypothetical protein DIPPA_24069 [Diplonema papillatum]